MTEAMTEGTIEAMTEVTIEDQNGVTIVQLSTGTIEVTAGVAAAIGKALSAMTLSAMTSKNANPNATASTPIPRA